MIQIRLKEVLEERGMTQEDLASRSGVGLPVLGDLCSGTARTVNLQDLDLICGVLECTVDDLFKRNETADFFSQ